jgi:hypothetical protein
MCIQRLHDAIRIEVLNAKTKVIDVRLLSSLNFRETKVRRP